MSDLSMNAKIHNARLEADLDLSDLPGGETGDEQRSATLVDCDHCGEQFDKEETGIVRCSSCHEAIQSDLVDLDDCTCDECAPQALIDIKDAVHRTTVDRAAANAEIAMGLIRESWDMNAYDDYDLTEDAIAACMNDVRSHLEHVIDEIRRTTRDTDI